MGLLRSPARHRFAWSLTAQAHHNPDFNRLNARIKARLNALPLSFLLYNDARTACDG
jgi:hypothetical protein